MFKVEPRHGKIVVAAVDGELTVKRLHLDGGRVTLMPENDAYDPITIDEHTAFHIWGVAVNLIKALY
jgi:DNA polymerase V